MNNFEGSWIRNSPDNIYFIIMLLNSAKLVCFLYLLASVLAVTSLTTGNCPEEYDFTEANITSDASADIFPSRSGPTLKVLLFGRYKNGK